MRGREKIEAAFSSDGSHEMAAVICYEGIYIRDHWTQLTSCPWWYKYEPDIERQMIWYRDVMEKTGQDWLVLPSFYTSEQRRALTIDVRENGVFLVDRSDGEEKALKAPIIGGEIITSGEKNSMINTPEEIDRFFEAEKKHRKSKMMPIEGKELASRLIQKYRKEKYFLYHVSSPLWCCYQLWGFEGMMTRLITHPDLVEYACGCFLTQCIQQVQTAKFLGADCIWIEECFTDMISPEMFETFNMPYVRPLIEEIRRAGLKSIYYYTGNPAGKMNMLIDSSADALAFEESKKDFLTDIIEIAEIVNGRCMLLGNIDSIGILQDADADGLKAEITRQAGAAKINKNRFVFSIGSPVTPDTPVEKVRFYCEHIHKIL
jgi:uroporphyrinogen-III decarboxylase